MKLVSISNNKRTAYHLFTDDLSEIQWVTDINLGTNQIQITIKPPNLELHNTTDIESWIKTQKLETL